jgi:hypothetical protein
MDTLIAVFEFDCAKCGKYWCDEFLATTTHQLPFENLCAIHECREVSGQSKSTWEKYDSGAHKRWFQFVAENIRLPREPGKSNWFDQFESSVDLKRIIQRRVYELRSGVTL